MTFETYIKIVCHTPPINVNKNNFLNFASEANAPPKIFNRTKIHGDTAPQRLELVLNSSNSCPYHCGSLILLPVLDHKNVDNT